MSPLEFSPQSASSTNFEQSEAASAKDTDIEPVAPTISANAATLENRIVDSSFSCLMSDFLNLALGLSLAEVSAVDADQCEVSDCGEKAQRL
jgi:hypothetical protein